MTGVAAQIARAIQPRTSTFGRIDTAGFSPRLEEIQPVPGSGNVERAHTQGRTLRASNPGLWDWIPFGKQEGSCSR